MYLYWSLCTLHVPGESYRRRLGSLLLCLYDVIRALINSLVCSGPRSVSDCRKYHAAWNQSCLRRHSSALDVEIYRVFPK